MTVFTSLRRVAAPGALCAAALCLAAPASAENRLIVNGREVALDGGADAAEAIERALAERPGAGLDLDIDLSFDAEDWSALQAEALAAALDALEASAAEIDADAKRMRVHVRTSVDHAEIERMAERAARLAERHVEAAAREAERYAERYGEQARRSGIRAGAMGMRAGLHGIDRALERGWSEDRDGVRRPLTEAEIADLEEARAELVAELARFEVEHAEILQGFDDAPPAPPAPGAAPAAPPREARSVRIHDGPHGRHVWIDGEKLEGGALTDWLNSEEGRRLAGAPDAPEPPR